MKTYCTQNNGNCKNCPLVNYDRDCKNNPIPEDELEQTKNDEDLKALIEAGREALTRIEAGATIVLSDLPRYESMLNALQALSNTRVVPII